MKKMMMLLMTIMLTVSTPNQSQAIVGISANDTALTVTGLVLMDLSQITVWDRRTDVRRDRYGRVRVYSYYTYRIITYPVFLLAGLVLLDAEGDLKLNAELPANLIEKAELTKNELTAYQNQIEEINSIMEMVAQEVSRAETESEKVELSGSLWTEYAEMLDVDAAIALKKIGIALQE